MCDKEFDLNVNRAELATILGYSLPTVDAMLRRGCPFLERGSNGRPYRFSLRAVLHWHIDELIHGPLGPDISRRSRRH